MTDYPETMKLHDLDGRPGVTVALFVHSRTEAMKWVRRGRTVTSAGDDGALNVWRDRRARLHVAFYRYRVEQDSAILPTLKALDLWLRQWFPRLSSRGRKKGARK